MKSKFYHISTKAGIFLSFLCAIHCLVMPIFMIAFPFLNQSILHDPSIEWTILITLIVLGSFSLNHYKHKHHGSNMPLSFFIVGVIICSIALIISSGYHQPLMLTGSIIIAISQIMNFTLKRTIPQSAIQ